MDSFYEVIAVTNKPGTHKGYDPTRLSRQESDTLRGLEEAIRRHGNPSLAEIAECASEGSSTGKGYYGSTVHTYLHRLADRGYVSFPEGLRPRGIRLLKREGEEGE